MVESSGGRPEGKSPDPAAAKVADPASAKVGAQASPSQSFWQRRKVFLTGHTGFKGAWLALWLQQLGAEVVGYSLAPGTDPSLYAQVYEPTSSNFITNSLPGSVIADIRNLDSVQSAMLEQQPEIVFHLAAQSLVRLSYQDPIGTYETNVLGTVNLLQAVRACSSVRAVVLVTTDKCYENQEWIWAYRENDRLGGYDPYSNSKACTELVASAYRNSFFSPASYDSHRVAIATARAGNVIGGGDWSTDRLLADAMRLFSSGEVLSLRNPAATRPWQHVLEPLRGYLTLAQKLVEDGPAFSGGWNFGPEYADARPVEWIASYLAKAWGPDARWEIDGGEHPHEAQMLKLDWSKAAHELGWKPRLRLPQALDMTLSWYKEVRAGKSAREKCLEQIASYSVSS